MLYNRVTAGESRADYLQALLRQLVLRNVERQDSVPINEKVCDLLGPVIVQVVLTHI
jgi:hypothetical protein